MRVPSWSTMIRYISVPAQLLNQTYGKISIPLQKHHQILVLQNK
jgi:hypothetical protein